MFGKKSPFKNTPFDPGTWIDPERAKNHKNSPEPADDKEEQRKQQEDRDRQEREQQDRERKQREDAQRKKAEEERLERERLKQLERDRIERERLERERLERERLERERLERERLAREEEARLNAPLELTNDSGVHTTPANLRIETLNAAREEQQEVDQLIEQQNISENDPNRELSPINDHYGEDAKRVFSHDGTKYHLGYTDGLQNATGNHI